MRVLVTGATGFIGRALCARLSDAGFELVAWVRDPESARRRLPGSAELFVASPGSTESISSALEGTGAVINLAGEPLFLGRWTEARKRRFELSRVALTRDLVRAIADTKRRPRLLVSGSAIGYYGDRKDEVLTEESTPGAGFLAGLCRDWESAATEAEALGLRVVSLRTGIVLGRGGGALEQMSLPFRLGLGGRLGSGEQYMSWIHLHDLVRLIQTTLEDDRYRGAVNGVGPDPVTNRQFTRALARALRRPAIMHVPKFALTLALGEAASAVLSSQRVAPAVARRLGFEFEHSEVSGALRQALAVQ